MRSGRDVILKMTCLWKKKRFATGIGKKIILVSLATGRFMTLPSPANIFTGRPWPLGVEDRTRVQKLQRSNVQFSERVACLSIMNWGPLKSLEHHRAMGLSGAHNWAPLMSRNASLPDSRRNIFHSAARRIQKAKPVVRLLPTQTENQRRSYFSCDPT